jgi:hypothetical protein
MTTEQPQVNPIAAWGKAAAIHLSLVALSFYLSFIVIQHVGLMPGEVLDCMACGFLLFHAVAAVVGVLFRRASIVSCVIVFLIAFFPGGLTGIQEFQKARYLRLHAPYDRFRDNLASPVPKSVANLHFLPLDEVIRPDLMFEFDIATEDMDAILTNLRFEHVDPAHMLNPKDYFQYAFYTPIAGPFQIFQGKDKFDEVLTIKTNESHSHAIFRKESFNFYRNRRWESGNSTVLRIEHEALERLKSRHGK